MIRPVGLESIGVRPAIRPLGSKTPQVSAMAPKFQGLHADAVLSADVPLALPTRNKAFDWLVASFEQTPFAHRELYLKREPRYGDAVSVSLDRSARQRVGYLPQEVAKAVAPMMDEGSSRFHVALMGVSGPPELPGLDLRVELLTNPGRSPNIKRLQAFHQALLGSGIPHQVEELQKARLKGDTVVRMYNHERSLENWYLNGHLLQRVDLNQDQSFHFQPAAWFRKRGIPDFLTDLIRTHSLGQWLSPKPYQQATAAESREVESKKEDGEKDLPPMRPAWNDDRNNGIY